MKHFLLFFLLISCTLTYAQTSTSENVKIINAKAEFPGGPTAFRNEFMRMAYAYVDVNAYAVNGKFSFVLTIDEKGKMSDLKIYPKVRNDEEFKQDMNFAMKRIKKKWKPAIQKGLPVSSEIIFEINFSTEHSDQE